VKKEKTACVRIVFEPLHELKEQDAPSMVSVNS